MAAAVGTRVGAGATGALVCTICVAVGTADGASVGAALGDAIAACVGGAAVGNGEDVGGATVGEGCGEADGVGVAGIGDGVCGAGLGVELRTATTVGALGTGVAMVVGAAVTRGGTVGARDGIGDGRALGRYVGGKLTATVATGRGSRGGGMDGCTRGLAATRGRDSRLILAAVEWMASRSACSPGPGSSKTVIRIKSR